MSQLSYNKIADQKAFRLEDLMGKLINKQVVDEYTGSY